jgi:hypothetical protein
MKIMTDEIETKLLEEIERIENKPRVAGEVTHPMTIPTLKERLKQHRQTKKWIEGLIDKEIKSIIKLNKDKTVMVNNNFWKAHISELEELKKQISGEGNGK